MSGTTGIEWTERTWNPVTGCTKVSPGCKHCYALTLSKRLTAMGTPGYENGFEVTLQPDRLNQPLRRKKPTMWFVNSMSDLFHDAIPDEYVERVIDVIRQKPLDVFQVLTKRGERLRDFFDARSVPLNMWLGVSVEDRRYGVPRIAELRRTPAAVRFLSVEPLLEDVGTLDLHGIHWVIVGGESGPKARPLEASWVRSVRDQCSAASVPFFFKQWGGLTPKAGGRLLDGKLHDAMPAPPKPVEHFR
ncbi:DUF5131 family protein [Parvularcula oceani]|uniref:DUF5131 family protein n=1 Tax=Parvularcula oceani TaxID=1247963 RepID=UPI0004E1B0E7|nr:phage Gp37/Gp68 family protein [Parvularcula oceani]